MTNFWFLLAGLLGPAVHLAPPDLHTCVNTYKVEYLELPVFPGSDLFQDHPLQLGFVRLGDWTNSELPVLVEVPGGPGGGTIGEDSALVKALGNPSWPRLSFDLRGVNCSPLSFSGLGEDASHAALDSALSAGDLVALIGALGLKHYVVYGISFGTLLATHLVSQLEAAHLPPPAAVILDGTIGRYGDTPAGTNDGDVLLWSRVRAQLPLAVQERFKAEWNPWGVSRQAWGWDIATTLETHHSGTTPVQALIDRYSSLRDENSRLAQTLIAQLKAWHPTGEAASYAFGGAEFYEAAVICDELDSHYTIFPTLTALELDYQGTAGDGLLRVCNHDRLARPFDSAKFSLRPPLIYLQGTDDALTSPEGARYHFESQTHAPRLWVEVAGAGHGVVPTEWGLRCGAALGVYLKAPGKVALGWLAAQHLNCDANTRTELRN